MMSVFIGRERDVTQLGEYLRDALQGKGKVVFIVGEAGIGKTRLIEEFKAQHLDRLNEDFRKQGKKTPEIRFADAKCNELAGKGEAYAPFFEMIAQFVADDKAFGSSKLAEIVREVGSDWFELVPVIGKALSLVSKTFFKWRKSDDVRQLADRQVQKEKLVQEFTHILKRMSDEHSLVLFLDDLHWADESSIALLFHIARHLQEQRILILGTYRPTDIEAARGDKAHPLKDVVYELHRYDLCATIKLGYLTKAHIRDFLDAYLGKHALDAAFVDYLHDLTEGNPLFVTEYVKLLQEIGKLTQTPQTSEVSQTSEVLASEVLAWTLRGTLRDADMPIPTSVEKVIEKRVERLKEELQKTLKYASVNGEQFNTLVLAKLLNWDEMELLEKLEALARVHQLVKEIDLAPGQTPRGAVYQFIHSLVQKSLYATLSAGIKSKLHAKAAEILEEVYHDDLETVAEELVEHYSRGQNHAQAAKYALLAARKANRQCGYKEAHVHAQRGLNLLDQAGYVQAEKRVKAKQGNEQDKAVVWQKIELLLELATTEESFGEAKLSVEHSESITSLLEYIDDQNFQGEVFYQIGNLLLLNRTTNYERILQVVEKSLALKTARQDYETIINVLETMREACYHIGKLDYCFECCQRIISLNQREQKIHLNVNIFKIMALICYEQGKYQDAHHYIEEGLKISLTMTNFNQQMELLQRIVIYAISLNNLPKAFEYYEQAKSIINATEEDKDNMFFQLGEIAWSLNKYDEAFEYYLIAKDIAHQNKNLNREGGILSNLMSRNKSLGIFDKAVQYGMEYIEVMERLGSVHKIIDMNNGIGWIFRNQGNYLKALEMHQNAAILTRKYGRERMLAHYLGFCYTDLQFIGKFREALGIIDEILDIYQRLNSINMQVEVLTDLAMHHFWIGEVEKALIVIKKAEQLNQTLQEKKCANLWEMRYSQILIGIGHYKEAQVLLENAVEDVMKRGHSWGDIPIHIINSTLIYLSLDELDRAVEQLHKIEEFFKKHVIMEASALLKDAYAQVYLAQCELAKAETSLNEAIALFQQMNSFRLGEAELTLAALRLAQNQPDAALQAAAAAHKIFQEIEYYRLGEAILWEAKSRLALRHFPETRAGLAAANAIFTRQQQPHHAAEAKLVEGQLLLAETGDKAQALMLFTEAQTTFTELGLKRLQKEAERVIEFSVQRSQYA